MFVREKDMPEGAYEIITQAIGFIGMALIIFSFQLKSNKAFYICQMTGALVFSVHYFMLGAVSAAVLNLIAVARGIFLAMGEKGKKPIYLVLLTLAFVVATAFSWQGWESLLPLIGQLTGMYAMWSHNGKVIRIAQLTIVSPPWLIYNILSGSIPGIICESFNMISTVISVIRYRKQL